MKSLMSLMQCMLDDVSMWCCTSTIRDWKTITDRVEHEGISFLTISLPAFCKDFERSLDDGQVSPSSFLGFKKTGALPRLFGGLLDLVFDRSSGLLLDSPSVDSIFFIRQLCLLFKKINLNCSEKRIKDAYRKYIECEKDVEEWDCNVAGSVLRSFDNIADLVWGPDLCDIDRKVYDHTIRPKHGPGTTADKLVGNAKYQQQSWTERLEGNFFPSADFLIPNWGFWNELGTVDFLEPDAEQPVRVVTVPKTLKTPRIIAIEPTCMQYTQQALMEVIVEQLEGSKFLSDSIGFTDQTRNQRLARVGSIDGSLATIDLSEASDRVSNLLVKRFLHNYRSLNRAVQATRSHRADVPGYGIISLAKFASMGSATCFPIEAMVFLTICCIAYQKSLNRPLSRKEFHLFLRRVRVYGDDIIVPTDIVRFVVCELEAFGLKVNTAKSFWTGKFRESCGKDYYDGQDVTVVYARHILPQRRSNVSEMLSAVSLRNQLYKAGFWKTAGFLDRYLKRIAPLPTVLETSPVVGRHSFLGHESQKMCRNLHKPLVKGIVVRPIPRASQLDGMGALLKFFLKRGSDPYFDAKHLERYGRPESVDIKIRWASPT